MFIVQNLCRMSPFGNRNLQLTPVLIAGSVSINNHKSPLTAKDVTSKFSQDDFRLYNPRGGDHERNGVNGSGGVILLL